MTAGVLPTTAASPSRRRRFARPHPGLFAVHPPKPLPMMAVLGVFAHLPFVLLSLMSFARERAPQPA